jgi:hypothetical protein
MDAAIELSDECDVTVSDLIRHGLILMLAMRDKLPDMNQDFGKKGSVFRIIPRLNEKFPVKKTGRP